MTAANYNFTGRVEITKNQFTISTRNEDDGHQGISFNIEFDKKLLNRINADKTVLVLDAVKRDKFERVPLLKKQKQVVKLTDFKIDSQPKLRISLVSTGEEKGLILLSTGEFGSRGKVKKPKKRLQEVEEEYQFFRMDSANDIGDQLWKLDWTDGDNVTILLNERIDEIFKGDRKNPILRGFLLPSIVRTVFHEMYLKFDSYEEIEGTDLENWFLWGFKVSGEKLPKTHPFKSGIWLAWLEKVESSFCSIEIGSEKDTFISSLEKNLGGLIK